MCRLRWRSASSPALTPRIISGLTLAGLPRGNAVSAPVTLFLARRFLLPPLARGEALDAPRSDAPAHQPQRRKTDRRRHAPHLPVASLDQLELDPRIRDV